MECSIDFKTDCARITLHDLPISVALESGTLNVAQLYQVLIHEDVFALDLMILLEAPEKRICAFLDNECQSIS
jgi:hypothetical protein